MSLLTKPRSNNNKPLGRTRVSQAFTIIELLIVIVIIGVLVAITAVSYTGITKSAKDATLRSDLKNAYTNVQLLDANPTKPTTNFTPSKGVNISYTPVTPAQPNSTNLCITASFPNDANISPLRMTSTGQIETGSCPNMLTSASCPTNWIVVPGNPYYGTTDFCVMKYQAKNVGGVATSQAAGTPWVSISQTNAKTTAAASGTGHHLITDPEWMTIAMNVINNPVNWSSGKVGDGFVYSGHNDNAPANALAASTDDNDGYFGTGDSAPSNQKRTLVLSNNEVIWDLSGNVWEWTDATITTGQPGLSGQAAYAWNEYTAATMQRNDLLATSWPTGTLYNASNGVGRLYSNPAKSAQRAFLRGGSWAYGSYAGALSLGLDYAPSDSDAGIGFRVSR